MAEQNADVEAVRKFWEENPLWSGESSFPPGCKEFFNEHKDVYTNDCFAGEIDSRIFPPCLRDGQKIKVLDLGCGVGFWTVELGIRGYGSIVAADLTETALDMTRRRCAIYTVSAEFEQQNAENLTFFDNTFDHVNCQGVIHHTPDTQKAIAEIARVLKPGGSACISVCYRNICLRSWPYLRWLGYPVAWLGGGLKGRGRERLFKSDADEVVRLYDGGENPVGKSYSSDQFKQMLVPFFHINEIFFHFFPARALPFRIPKLFHRWLDRRVPFMIYANVEKPCAE